MSQHGSGNLATVPKVCRDDLVDLRVLSSACVADSVVNALQPPNVYLGPDIPDATPCVCNTVSYATLAACAVCQGLGLAITT